MGDTDCLYHIHQTCHGYQTYHRYQTYDGYQTYHGYLTYDGYQTYHGYQTYDGYQTYHGYQTYPGCGRSRIPRIPQTRERETNRVSQLSDTKSSVPVLEWIYNKSSQDTESYSGNISRNVI